MKKLTTALLIVVLCLCLVFAVACQRPDEPVEETEAKIDMLNGWKQNDDDPADTYIIEVKDGVMTAEFDTADWEWMKRNFLDDVDTLAKMKTMVIEGKLESNVTPLKVTLSLVFTDTGKQEVHVMFSETSRTYEWDLSDFDMTKCTHMMIFVQGGKSAAGTLTISKMYMTAEAINSANNVTNFPGIVPDVPAEHAVKEITATDTKVDAGWYGNKDVYTITKVGDVYKVEFNKNGEAWAGVMAYCKGDVTAMKSFKFVVKAAEGTRLMLKPLNDNSVQPILTCTGGDDEVEVDITSLAPNASTTEELMIVIIAAPNDTLATGSFEIKGAEFSTEEASNVPVEPEDVVNEITAENKAIGNWYAEPGYTITEADGVATVVKAAGAGRWNQVKAYVTGEAIGTMKSFKIVLNGDAGTRVIVKPLNVNTFEETVVLTGEDDEVIVNLVGITGVDYSSKLAVLLFVNPLDNDPATEATFTIKSAEFSTEEKPAPAVPDYVNEVTADAKSISHWYHEEGYTLSEENGVATVVKAANAERWAQVKAYVTGEAIGTMKSFKIVINGDAGTRVIVKPLNVNTFEENVVLTGEDDEIIVNLVGITGVDYTQKLAVLIFVNPLDNDPTTETTFAIKSAEFSTEEKPAPAPTYNVKTLTASDMKVDAGWYGKDYTISESEGVFTVSYTKPVGGEWTAITAYCTGDVTAMKTVKLTLKGAEGLKLMIKPFDAKEHIHTCTGADDEVIVDISDLAPTRPTTGELKLVIIAAPGVVGVSGSFEIKNAEFSTDAAPVTEVYNHIQGGALSVMGGWYTDAGDPHYEFVKEEDNTYTVTYTNVGEWSWFKANVDGDNLSKVRTFIIKVKGTAGKEILVKPFDIGYPHEKRLTLTGGEDILIMAVPETANFARKAVFIMAEPEVAGVSGTFQILDARFSYGTVNEVTAENASLSGWYDAGDGKYTIAVADGQATVTKAADGSWAQLKLDMTGAAIADKSVLKMVISGAEGAEMIVNVLGQETKYEREGALPAGQVEVTVDFTSKLANANLSDVISVTIFFNMNATAESSFVIESAELVAPATGD